MCMMNHTQQKKQTAQAKSKFNKMENTNDDIQNLLNKIKTLNNKEEIEVLIERLQILIEKQQDNNSSYLNQLKEEVKRLSSL